ncbi:MAG: sulfite exporter TauE/SafE family protein [Kineosporiaceae bacterium]
MTIDWWMAVGGLVVGFVVGLTGMGGGALMTPMLVLLFNVNPLTAVSSDLVTSAVMKPVGSIVHIRRRTVSWSVVGWLMAGSVPSAFCGVFVLNWLGGDDPEAVQHAVKKSLGIALIIATCGLIAKAWTEMNARATRRSTPGSAPAPADDEPVVARRLPTVLIGLIGGLVVGMTSVGSGSLIIVALMAVYPRLSMKRLVGTDLVQAVPLVAAAALGHVLYGDFELDITTSLLLGSIPGVWLGARWSSVAPTGLLRRALSLVLLASALKLLEVPTATTGVVLIALVLLAPPLWVLLRRSRGLRDGSFGHELVSFLTSGGRGRTQAQPQADSADFVASREQV